ncbi:hypothetical protein [Saccharopolyspora gloriosae]|uniref:hypothetical protein n=1 Tax=Saccharopolyspora gloriosae TaxID=455344 RepID=UPI001FB5D2A1|nr:hypothetical protein [Saccharopolyspora gloriosae]
MTLPRIDTVAREFLRYLYAEDHFRPEVAAFLHSAQADVLAPPPDHDELAEVVGSLRGEELVATGTEHADGLPLRAGLTGSGLICVSEHDGDLRAWRESAGVAVLTARAPTVVAPRESAEPTTVPPDSLDGIARVAKVCLLALPTVHARYGEDELVQRTAQRLWEAARSARPDPRRVRLLASKLRGELATGSMANTLGVVLLDSLDEAVREAQLP